MQLRQKKILILCTPDPNNNPRPNRMIYWLKSSQDLTVVGGAHIRLEDVRSFALLQASQKGSDSWLYKFFRKVQKYTFNTFRYLYFLFSKRYEDILWLKFDCARMISDELSKDDFDLIISHDIVLMPLAFAIKGKKASKIMLDAREFYPRNFDDSPRWRLLTKPVNIYLCDTYLHRCDKIITVSDGIAQEYNQKYNVNPEVIMSLPESRDLQPASLQTDTIRIIHHGNASSSRKIELMIEMMDFTDERYTLDLMMVVMDTKYWSKIVSMVEKRKNVHIVPPVPMQEIVPKINQYDIGLFLVPPSNFNLKHTLPNKFFEFIQARLAVAIGPSIEMKKIVEKYDCGIVSKNFEPVSLAKELNHLTSEKISYFKEQSHEAAQTLNASTNKILVDGIISSLLADKV